ncbi:hypothetical protein GCM10009718_31220 [Isoptericola halotolerans]|uniref:Uncharacterized protein n=1 Tax=Isoptericola halotolerans TaxID=300560 RepID=A0ABX2A2H3_9MICO|nr:hypothetical protein [Isoptericola halotolerans]NOV96945.1 hypothetical protein [Isoptericola halotolerans]
MDAPTPKVPAAHGRPAVAPSWVWRSLAAAGVVVSALVHLVLWTRGYDDIPLVGPLFLVNAISGVVLAVLLLTWRHWLPLVGGIIFGAATLLAFVASATSDLLGITTQVVGTTELVAAAAELVAVVASTIALVREQAR